MKISNIPFPVKGIEIGAEVPEKAKEFFRMLLAKDGDAVLRPNGEWAWLTEHEGDWFTFMANPKGKLIIC
jgi:hypothetical protein